MINVPPHQMAFEDRISEATLAFTKKFWEKQPFLETSPGSEAKEFLVNRVDQCQEISWGGIIVSLLLSGTGITRTLPLSPL